MRLVSLDDINRTENGPRHAGWVNLAALDRIAATVTPTVPISDPASGCTIWAKLEYEMPSGSTKDRIAAQILATAARAGVLTDESVVVEASSGSTSIAFAMACAAVGVHFVAVMPEGVSNERILIIRRYGADVVLTPAAAGVPGAIAEVESLASRGPLVFLPRQFANVENARAHQWRTGPELIAQVGHPLDGFVAAVGTAGTLMGVGAALRAAYGETVALARVQVAGEADAEQGGPCSDIPGVVDCMSALLDGEALALGPDIEITHDDALVATRHLIARGFPAGLSSGLNYLGACALAKTLGPDHHVATVFCDRMERYFSSELFDDLR
ncbi:MAG TPA: cysteine synthase family protein [Acidimicrobiales bacterium]|nr:cysteine synthase family protein [Acidimicrobiales bacterium]